MTSMTQPMHISISNPSSRLAAFRARPRRLRAGLVLGLALLTGCASQVQIDKSYTSISQDSRVQFLILHYTYGNFESSLKTLTAGPVSSHYLVSEKPPVIYQLVDETRRSYHAGVSSWRGNTALNGTSIGIEIVNAGGRPGPDGKLVWAEYPKDQIDAVIALSKKIVKEHAIKPDRVLGHGDIAPTRKVDPGPKFPWKRFADEGLIQWPSETEVARRRPAFEDKLPDVGWFQDKLMKHGYATVATGQMDRLTKDALASLQMKYRQSKFDGAMDAETAAILDVLTMPLVVP